MDPTFILPDRVLDEHRMTRSTCPDCRVRRDQVSPGHSVPACGAFFAGVFPQLRHYRW